MWRSHLPKATWPRNSRPAPQPRSPGWFSALLRDASPRQTPHSYKGFLSPGKMLTTHSGQCGYLFTNRLNLKFKRMNRLSGTWALRQFIPTNSHRVSAACQVLCWKGRSMGLGEPTFLSLSFPLWVAEMIAPVPEVALWASAETIMHVWRLTKCFGQS